MKSRQCWDDYEAKSCHPPISRLAEDWGRATPLPTRDSPLAVWSACDSARLGNSCIIARDWIYKGDKETDCYHRGRAIGTFRAASEARVRMHLARAPRGWQRDPSAGTGARGVQDRGGRGGWGAKGLRPDCNARLPPTAILVGEVLSVTLIWRHALVERRADGGVTVLVTVHLAICTCKRT